jgi:hypothetical protein
MPSRDPERSETPPVFARVGSNDSNISSWTFSQRTPGSSTRPKSSRNLNNLTPSGKELYRTPRRPDSSSLLLEGENSFRFFLNFLSC